MSCNNSCSTCSSASCSSPTAHCGKCCGGSCSKQPEVSLTPFEIALLQQFSSYPFLPAARDASGTPIYLPDPETFPGSIASAEEISTCLNALEAKQILSIDDRIPIKNYNYDIAYHEYPIHGSMALTAFGQDVLDSLIYQSVSSHPT